MTELSTLRYEQEGAIAHIRLNRPARGNGITLAMPREIAQCVEQANLDPEIRVIALSGEGSGFCGGYDLVDSAENMDFAGAADGAEKTVLDPALQARNHQPKHNWDPTLDYQMMRRNVRGFMSLFHSELPVVCKVHGYCVAGGTDMALCSDLLLIADDAKIGYPPARVWGCPTTAMWIYRLGLEKAKRLLFTGDCLNGRQAVEWGLAVESAPPEELDQRFSDLLDRIARMPRNQLIMMKMLLNQSVHSQGLEQSQMLGTLLDGVTRHTEEGHAFREKAMQNGFMAAVRERDDAFGDFGLSSFRQPKK